MKHLFASLLCCVLFFGSVTTKGQSFTVVHDTMWITSGTISTLFDSVFVTTTTSVTLEWKLISSDFPADWSINAGFCDPMNCYFMNTVYPSGYIETSPFGMGYGGGNNLFSYSNDLTAASPGCHYVRVRVNNQAIPTDTAIITYIMCKPAAAQVAAITSSSEDEISFYPNPATNSLNVVYSDMLGVKNIAIYNIIGKQVNIYSPIDSKGAMLNIENIPSGIYYVRLLNENGNVIATRRFMKQ